MRHARHSMLLIPTDTPGVEFSSNIAVVQYPAPEGHCEIVFREVRVPSSHLFGQESGALAMAQERLGQGCMHRSMRTIDLCELALALMCDRALERQTFGNYLTDYANVQQWIAELRLEIDQAYLLVLRTVWQLDQGPEIGCGGRGDAGGGGGLQTRVANRAIQVFGVMGLSPDTPLAYFWAWRHALQLLDGPDEVHLRSIARNEVAQARESRGASTAYFALPEQLLAEPRIR